jgi:PleD family two-component response regulator
VSSDPRWTHQSYGGLIADEKSKAKVLIVDDDGPNTKSAQTIRNNYGSDVRKFIEPYQWVERSIRRGAPPVLAKYGCVPICLHLRTSLCKS